MRRIVLAGMTVVAIGGLAACSGTDGSGVSDTGKAAPSAGVPQADAGSRTADRGAASAPNRPSTLTLEPAKIRTADLTVDVTGSRNVAVRADAAGDIAVRAGGEVDADERSSGTSATATLRLRVPPAELQGTLHTLSRLGETKSRHLSSRDVTQQVADVESRTASAAQAIARLRALYRDATKVSDVISIEGELSQREADLESLQAQQRTLAAQTSMASITLYLRTAPKAAAPKHTDRTGFLGGLHNGWDAFISAAGSVATAAGAVLPFLVLVLLVGAGLRLLWPRLVPRRREPASAPSSE